MIFNSKSGNYKWQNFRIYTFQRLDRRNPFSHPNNRKARAAKKIVCVFVNTWVTRTLDVKSKTSGAIRRRLRLLTLVYDRLAGEVL